MAKKRYFLRLRRWIGFDDRLIAFKKWLKLKLRKALGIESIDPIAYNLLYEVMDLVQNNRTLLIPKVASCDETISTLLTTEKSLARFGDGEFKMMFLGGQIGFQQRDEKLQARLKEVLASKEPNLMIGIPDMFGALGPHESWRELMGKIRDPINQYLSHDIQYYNAAITRNITSIERCHNLKKIWEGKHVTTIEGAMCRLGVGNDLFDNTASLKRILAPAECAFSVYDKILSEALKQSKDELFLLALGPTATVLAHDLCVNGYRALDIGHLDICYELLLRGLNRMVAIEGKYVNEASYRSPAPCNDKRYLSQIIGEVK